MRIIPSSCRPPTQQINDYRPLRSSFLKAPEEARKYELAPLSGVRSTLFFRVEIKWDFVKDDKCEKQLWAAGCTQPALCGLQLRSMCCCSFTAPTEHCLLTLQPSV